MKMIDCWAGMQPYGIVPLTIEADGLKHRVVCDVTEKGKQLIEKTLGVPSVQLEKNWDHGPNDEPHVGSMLLSPELLMMLGIYALLDDGCHEVWTTRSNGLIGIQQSDCQQIVENLRIYYGTDLVHRFLYPETTSTWNPNALVCMFH
jgi:hypothetical protein